MITFFKDLFNTRQHHRETASTTFLGRSSMRPPIFSTMSTQMDKPSPTPWENSLRL